jgi:hypothetical protein
MLPQLYTKWVDGGWSLLTGRPETPAEKTTPKAAHVAAVQEWEHEGGSLKPEEKTDTPEKPGKS